jgi:hypothetical protein
MPINHRYVSYLPIAANEDYVGVNPRLDMEDFPIGSWVKTPTGRIGTVLKHRGAQSRHDLFQRVIVGFFEPIGDSVALQPHLLTIIDKPDAANDSC